MLFEILMQFNEGFINFHEFIKFNQYIGIEENVNNIDTSYPYCL